MRLIIAGGRDFNDYSLLEKSLNKYLQYKPTVVCGGARGGDSLGQIWATNNNFEVDYFIPDWNTHGKKAGILRNMEMAENADSLVAFWDGESKGTKHMIEYATKLGLKVEVIKYDSNSA